MQRSAAGGAEKRAGNASAELECSELRCQWVWQCELKRGRGARVERGSRICASLNGEPERAGSTGGKRTGEDRAERIAAQRRGVVEKTDPA